MRRAVVQALFVGEVLQHQAAQLAVGQVRVQRAEVGRERRDVVPVLGGILAQVLARQFALRPRLVVGMLQQVVVLKAGIEGVEENGGRISHGKSPVLGDGCGSRFRFRRL